jgi:hypothetical protein
LPHVRIIAELPTINLMIPSLVPAWATDHVLTNPIAEDVRREFAIKASSDSKTFSVMSMKMNCFVTYLD